MTEVAATAAPVNDDAIDSDVKENGDTKMEEANDENKPANEDNTITADEVSVPIPESAHEEQSKSNRKKGLDEAKRYNQRNRNHNDKHSRPQREKHDRFSFDKNRGSHRQNIKFDPASLPDSDDPEAIRKQFYFSTSNLLTDKFLFTKMEGHKNIPVPIDVIYSFKRMQRFKPREAVISALKDSNLLSVVNEDNDVQRREPIAEDLTGKSMEEVQKVHEDQSMARSVYAKGFGEEEASTQFDIEAFFSNYGTTNSVRLRRQTDGVFKQSVFVEFDGEELATNFLAIDPPPNIRIKN
ncbi:uncharacterized protein KY384_008701 [Bacidia gigantensis]|uniref:uncharacterized protein n=1 Tax=Bacidia gigantensis TaxID=2732470 RepID=UPI001D059C29|nr:uncharacterized protein KY384_008701 [Bacidia gigantensis]KAG8526501.1 hypothetical protein KY384_008701 [Bacidia gigantensis]